MDYRTADGTPIMPHRDDSLTPDGFTQADRIKLDRVERFITGGSEPERGLNMRIDRLEQARKAGAWWAKTALTAAIGAVVLALWNAITHGRTTP